MDVTNAIKSRFSARSFLGRPVAKSTVKEILRQASYAPSGANMQPWKVHAISGEALQNLVESALASARQGFTEEQEYPTYPSPLPEPFSTRRFETGMGLYRALGIERSDRAGREIQLLENFRFFGAPVGLIFTLNKIFVPGQLGDLGMFIQNVMLLCRHYGLHSCPQGAWQLVNQTVHRELGIPDQDMIYCGMALGYADDVHPANTFQPPRIPLEEFADFSGFDDKSNTAAPQRGPFAQ